MSNDDDNSSPSLSDYAPGSNDWQDAGETSSEDSAPRSESPPQGGAEPEREPEIDPDAVERHIERLLAEKKLCELMESGEYTAFRNRLREREGRTDDPARLEAIHWALGNPDAFAEPVRKAPTLWTINGTGTKVYGEDQYDSTTGLYLTTLYLTLLWVPLFPLKRYLVRQLGDEYEFRAKVDVASFHNWWRGLVAAGVLVAAGAVAFGVATYQPDVQFINGLDRPVEVSVDGETTVDIPAHSTTVEDLPSGKHTFVARFDGAPSDEAEGESGGTVIEKRPFEVPKWSDLIAYNVGGFAPAYVRSVTYYATAAGPPKGKQKRKPTIKPIAGRSRYVSDDVDYIREEPPDEIEMPEDTDKTVHWEFRYDGEGLPTTARMLRHLAPERLGDFLKRAIELKPRDEWFYTDLREELRRVAENEPQKLGGWFDFLESVAKEHPTAMSLHSFYASQARAYADQLDRPDPVETYRNHHKQEKTARSALMLAHVVESREGARTLLKEALEKAPEDSKIALEAHGELGALIAESGDCTTANEHFQTSRQSGGELGEHYLDLYAICLSATDAHERAVELLRERVDPEAPSAIKHAVTFGQIALGPDSSENPFALFNTVASEANDFSMSDDLRVLFGTRMGRKFAEAELAGMELSPRGEEYAKIHRTIYETPEKSAEVFAEKPGRLESMGDGVKSFVTLQAYLHGDDGTLQKIATTTGGQLKPLRELIDQEGEETEMADSPPAHWLPPEKASWHIARATTLSDPDKKSEALMTAKETLRVHGPLTVVADTYLENLE